MNIPLPKPGYSLVDLCRLCAEHAIQMHIGVADIHIAEPVTTVTIQFTSAKLSEPERFAVRLPLDSPHLNLGVSKLVRDFIQKSTMKPRITLVKA